MFQSLPKAIIHLDAITHNFNYCKTTTGKQVGAVVKANAYGLGMKEVATELNENTNCSSFFVANITEGIELRKIIKNKAIYVFHGVFEKEAEYFYEHNLIPVLNDFYQLEIWQNFARFLGKKLATALHFDTGMNRLGISFYQLKNFVEKLDPNLLNVNLVLSHLSFAENKNSELNIFQLEKFKTICEYFPNTLKSFANSPGVFLDDTYYFDMIRIGRALYGPNKYANLPNELRPALTVYAPIIQIRELIEDEPIGYAATHISKKGSKIITLSIGYADGYMRLFGNIANVYLEGFSLPVIGKISMDLITVDASQIPEQYLRIGKYVEVIGPNTGFHNILVQSGTSSSELFSRLGSRIIKEYSKG